MNPLEFKYYCENFLKIKTKDSILSPFIFNMFQNDLHKRIKELEKNNKPIRIIILKARQLGISTFIAAYTYHRAATSFNTKVMTIADSVENTNNLFAMQKTFFEHSDPKIKPMQAASNEKAIIFDNPNKEERIDKSGLKSSIHLATAGKKTVGRGGTVQWVHCSEFSFWDDAATVITGLFQSVPYLKNTGIFAESTANGIAGRGAEFKKRWDAAKKGDSDYIPVFYPWNWNPEYRIIGARVRDLDDYEKYIVEKFNVSGEQLAWRRWKIANEMGSATLDPFDQMCQEFPIEPREAFISSGRPVFKMRSLQDKIEKAKSFKYETFEI